MKRILVLVLLAASSAPAAQNNAASILERAIQKETVDGDLKAAVDLYKAVLAQRGVTRPVAARALLHLGQCQEKLAAADARTTYERLLREYSDQGEIATQARQRLKALNGPVATAGITARQVWTGPDVDPQGSVSPDGKYLAYTDWDSGDIAIRDLATGEKRRVTNKGKTWKESGSSGFRPIFSPDGKRLAFAWQEDQRPSGWSGELRIVGVDGSGLRTVLRRADTPDWPWDWSPDGRQILVGRFQLTQPDIELILVSADDGSTKVVRPPAPLVWTPRFSPDGRHLAYTRSQRIYLCAIDGSGETLIAGEPTGGVLLDFSPDGGQIVFVSNRTGSIGTWTQEISGGRPRGEPRLVNAGVETGMPMGMTRNGALFYGVTSSLEDVYTAEIDLVQGTLAAPKSIRQRPGVNQFPDYSPDGRRLVYLSDRGAGDRALVIQSLETGKLSEVKPQIRLTTGRPVAWHPDGRSFVVVGRNERGTGTSGLFGIDVESGEGTLIASQDEMQSGFHALISPDGKTLYNRITDQSAGMYRMDLASKRIEITYKPESDDSIGNHSPALSRDGQWIAFRINNFNAETTTLAIMPAAGGPVRRLLSLRRPDVFTSQYPCAFTPDGKELLFVRTRNTPGAQCELWRISASGGEPRKLGDLALEAAQNLHVRPDGKQIAFRAGRSQSEVWVLENFLPR